MDNYRNAEEKQVSFTTNVQDYGRVSDYPGLRCYFLGRINLRIAISRSPSVAGTRAK